MYIKWPGTGTFILLSFVPAVFVDRLKTTKNVRCNNERRISCNTHRFTSPIAILRNIARVYSITTNRSSCDKLH